MKISAIRVYRVDLPLVEGRYSWSEGKFVEVFDSTVVELATDDGLSGYGEVCPLGPFYLPAFGPGARAGHPNWTPPWKTRTRIDPGRKARKNGRRELPLQFLGCKML